MFSCDNPLFKMYLQTLVVQNVIVNVIVIS